MFAVRVRAYTHIACASVCVCVRERERERERSPTFNVAGSLKTRATRPFYKYTLTHASAPTLGVQFARSVSIN